VQQRGLWPLVFHRTRLHAFADIRTQDLLLQQPETGCCQGWVCLFSLASTAVPARVLSYFGRKQECGHNQGTTLFFDLGGTLADPVFGSDGKLTGFTAFPGAKAGRRECKRRIVIHSTCGNLCPNVELIPAPSSASHVSPPGNSRAANKVD